MREAGVGQLLECHKILSHDISKIYQQNLGFSVGSICKFRRILQDRIGFVGGLPVLRNFPFFGFEFGRMDAFGFPPRRAWGWGGSGWL